MKMLVVGVFTGWIIADNVPGDISMFSWWLKAAPWTAVAAAFWATMFEILHNTSGGRHE
jgi:hypothetical protein